MANDLIYDLHPFDKYLSGLSVVLGCHHEINSYREKRKSARRYPCLYYFLLGSTGGTLNASAKQYTNPDIVRLEYMVKTDKIDDFCKQHDLHNSFDVHAILSFMQRQLLEAIVFSYDPSSLNTNLRVKDTVWGKDVISVVPIEFNYRYNHGVNKETGVICTLRFTYNINVSTCCIPIDDNLQKAFKEDTGSWNWIENNKTS